ncbi:MAG: branched-chain amino acid ABC transporter permease [Methylobacteriaceae bacterium]|nr:branched-chain amino acid ABC transporter permease [Methylobacteriaceae bacterium]
MSPDVEAVAGARRWLAGRARWRWWEIAFWLAAAASFVLLPSRHLILAEIAILGLFALSLDLLLGYVGIVSLGHAAFFGVGAYAAGLMAKHVGGEPLLGFAVAVFAAATVGLATSFLVLRGADLTRLMVTLGVAMLLGEAANQWSSLTGGADGLQGMTVAPLLGLFEFDLFGRTAYGYALVVLFLCFLIARRIVNSPYGLSLRAIRDNPLRAAALGIAVDRRIVGVYTLAAAMAGAAGALLAQTTAFVSLDVFDFNRSADVLLVLVIGGAGYLYGGLIGAVFFKIAADLLSAQTPQYWHFWIGLILVVLVLAGRDRLGERLSALARRARLTGGAP